jgi:hypothetical protein
VVEIVAIRRGGSYLGESHILGFIAARRKIKEWGRKPYSTSNTMGVRASTRIKH